MIKKNEKMWFSNVNVKVDFDAQVTAHRHKFL